MHLGPSLSILLRLMRIANNSKIHRAVKKPLGLIYPSNHNALSLCGLHTSPHQIGSTNLIQYCLAHASASAHSLLASLMPLVLSERDRKPPSQYDLGTLAYVEKYSSKLAMTLPPSFKATPSPSPSVTVASTQEKVMGVINHEFRALQLDKSLTAMSAFDLIDHCASLFEELSRRPHSDEGFRSYVRAYLIFNYFVNTFIMVHFNGFAKFMESSHQDFIIYLNLYNFFRTDDIIGDVFEVDLLSVRLWVVQYLTMKDLLTFDVDLLHGWLDEYIEYLKHKDEEPDDDEKSTNSEYYKTEDAKLFSLSSYLDEDSDTNMFDFNSRFPEVETTSSPYPSDKPKAPYPTEQKTPYPVGVSADQLARSVRLSQSPAPVQILSRSPATVQSLRLSRSPAPVQSQRLSRSPAPVPPTYVRPLVLTPKRNLDPVPTPVYANGSVAGHNGVAVPAPFPQAPRIQNQQYAQPGQMMATQPQVYAQHQLLPLPHQQFQQPAYSQQPPQAYSQFQQYLKMPPGMPVPQSGMPQQSPQAQEKHRKYQWMKAHAICGLKNLGSSCYINLTVQVMFGLNRFTQLFHNNAHLQKLVRASRRPTALAEAVSGLLGTFQASGGATIAPTKFLRVLTSLKPGFNIPFEQQDAQEFLLFLLDKLHEELAIKPTSDSMEIAKWDMNVSAKDKDEYLKWYHNLVQHEGESPVNDMFQGHVQSKLVCNKCGHKSISYSPFSILSLPIPNKHGRGVDLTDCLRYFTQDEVLSGENAWNCPKCNKVEGPTENPIDVVFQPKRGMFRLRRSKSPSKKSTPSTVPAPTSISIKQLSFIKLPPVLFIHLSRFSMFNVTDKLDTDITYPLRLKFNHATHDIYYNLTGLINHYGNLKSGHYTSLVNKSSHSENDNLLHPYWCYFDDDRLRINVSHGNIAAENLSKLRSRDVYVLCYEQA